MRSAASHFSLVIKFVIFVAIVVALSLVVIHFARNSDKGPQPSQPASNEASQSVSEDNKKVTGNKDKQKSSSDNSKSKTLPSDNSTNTPANSPDGMSSNVPSQTVPATGLNLYGTLTGLAGIMTVSYLLVVYLRSRSQLFEV